MNPKHVSLKVNLDYGTTVRITAMVVEDPTNPDYARVSFGYQSPLDQDWRKKGRDAAYMAMMRHRYVAIPRKHITRDRLLILAMGMSVVYPQGIQWMKAIIREIGEKWLENRSNTPSMITKLLRCNVFMDTRDKSPIEGEIHGI
jgi:hypothetical protein